jgi:hypothetical protein
MRRIISPADIDCPEIICSNLDRYTTISSLKYSSMSKEISTKKFSNQPSFIWFLGFIGAVIYYIQHATTFWIGAVGFFKAIVWPAFLVYKLLAFLKM